MTLNYLTGAQKDSKVRLRIFDIEEIDFDTLKLNNKIPLSFKINSDLLLLFFYRNGVLIYFIFYRVSMHSI